MLLRDYMGAGRHWRVKIGWRVLEGPNNGWQALKIKRGWQALQEPKVWRVLELGEAGRLLRDLGEHGC